MAKMRQDEQLLLRARMIQVKDELSRVAKERAEVAALDAKIRELERERDTAQKALANEMSEKVNEGLALQLLLGIDAPKEEVRLDEVKTLIEDRGLKAKVHSILHREITLQGRDLIFGRCINCPTDCWTGCTTCYKCTSDQLLLLGRKKGTLLPRR